jgi:hypothetical protein
LSSALAQPVTSIATSRDRVASVRRVGAGGGIGAVCGVGGG